MRNRILQLMCAVVLMTAAHAQQSHSATPDNKPAKFMIDMERKWAEGVCAKTMESSLSYWPTISRARALAANADRKAEGQHTHPSEALGWGTQKGSDGPCRLSPRQRSVRAKGEERGGRHA